MLCIVFLPSGNSSVIVTRIFLVIDSKKEGEEKINALTHTHMLFNYWVCWRHIYSLLTETWSGGDGAAYSCHHAPLKSTYWLGFIWSCRIGWWLKGTHDFVTPTMNDSASTTGLSIVTQQAHTNTLVWVEKEKTTLSTDGEKIEKKRSS